MPKKKTPELSPKEQFKRFQETAKKLGVEDTGKDAEKAFSLLAKKVAKAAPKTSI